MSPADRRLYDLIRAMGTATGKQLHDRQGPDCTYGKLHAQMDRLEEEGWIKEMITDAEGPAARPDRHERVFYVARLPDDH
jgi:hypothetical protein